MSKLSNKQRLEWKYFIGKDRQRHFNKLCQLCVKLCKQSFRAVVVNCKKYKSQ